MSLRRAVEVFQSLAFVDQNATGITPAKPLPVLVLVNGEEAHFWWFDPIFCQWLSSQRPDSVEP
jgi:hypothetical protein